MSSRSTINVRLPISCEPCRRRKIRCSRTRPVCDTCQRRACADLCNYTLSDVRGTTKAVDSISLTAAEELRARIRTLEEILVKQSQTEQILPPLGIHRPNTPLSSPPAEEGDSSATLSDLGLHSHNGSFNVESNANCPSLRPRSSRSLSTTASGNVRFEPRSSQWMGVLENTGINIDDSVPLVSHGINTIPDVESNSFPFSSAPQPTRDDLLLVLPSMTQIEYLKGVYFDVFSSLFHILHDLTFLESYDKFVQDSSSVSLSWLAILSVVISLAVSSLDDEDPILRDLSKSPEVYSRARLLGKQYREVAMKCLVKQGIFWGKHNIESLQALILLIYAMSHNHEPTWALLGMTYNIAIALGCHIDPDKFDLNPVQSEERRRCWAGLMMLYTIQNTLLGSPDPSWKPPTNVRLPADANDIDISASGMIESAHSPTQMTYLLYKFKLYELTASICHEVFACSKPAQDVIDRLDQKIRQTQEAWDERYLSDSSFEALPVHHAAHLHILHGYAHQLFLLLHRPTFTQSTLGMEIPNASQIRCIASAEALLDIHEVLCETPIFKPYMWYTYGLGSFHALHASVVLYVALLMPIYQPQYPKFLKSLEQALVRFRRMSMRSLICTKAARITHQLLSSLSQHQQRNRIPLNFSVVPSTSILSSSSHSDYSQPAIIPLHEQDYFPDFQTKFFSENLSPQQWLSPSSLSWFSDFSDIR